MNKKLLVVALSAVATLLTACVVTPVPSYREPVLVEPPPPRVEYPGYPPYAGYVWFGGYWTWTGYRHEWVPGRWDAPRPGYRWVAPRWEREGSHWRQHEGRWEQEHSPRVVVQPAPPAPRYEQHRPESIPQPRQERGYQPPPPPAPAAIPAPRHDYDNRPPARQPDIGRGQPEPRMAPPAQPQPQAQPAPSGRDDRDREHGDRRSGRRGQDDDRR